MNMIKKIIIVMIIILILFFYYLVDVFNFIIYNYNNDHYKIYITFILKLIHHVDKKNVQLHSIEDDKNSINNINIIYIKNPFVSKTIVIFNDIYANIVETFKYVKKFYHFSSIIVFNYRNNTNYKKGLFSNDEKSYRNDCITVWNYVVNKMNIKNDISLMGVQLGCSLCLWLTAHLSENFLFRPSSIILESPSYSFRELLVKQFSRYHHFLLGNIVINALFNKYETDKYLKKINIFTNILIIYKIDNYNNFNKSIEIYETLKNTHKNITLQIVNNINSDKYIYCISNLNS